MDLQLLLNKYIVDELLNGSTNIEIDENLLADGMVDSLGMLRLVAYIEDSLGIKIPHADLVIENFRTIEVITQYLDRRKAA